MSGISIDYQIGDIVPMCAMLINVAGQPDSGKNLTIQIIDHGNDIELLAEVAMPESSNFPGVYRYLWDSSGLTQKTHIIAIIRNTQGNGSIIDIEEYSISDLKQFLERDIDDNDGRGL